MKFCQPDADLFVPDRVQPLAALARTTHLGIGAHQDDLEFMALHGILECYGREDRWFGGITCTDGSGSSRTGPYADYTDDQMKAVRLEEQKSAANIGQYAFIAQLGHPGKNARDAACRQGLVKDIAAILEAAQPEVVYTHNPFDKHATHTGVLQATLEAIRSLPVERRPEKLFGCEVWRGLDWLPDNLKVIHDVSTHSNLAAELNRAFDSQISGGKRYDLAVEGRRLANATFHESHAVDAASRVSYAIDLAPLMREDGPSFGAFIDSVLRAFDKSIFRP